MQRQIFFILIIITISLCLLNCNKVACISDNSIIVNVYYETDKPETPSNGQDLLISIFNNLDTIIMLKRCNYTYTDNKEIEFRYFFLFSGKINNFYSYPGPRIIPERPLCKNIIIDTIESKQMKVFHFDSVYRESITDSLDFIFFYYTSDKYS